MLMLILALCAAGSHQVNQKPTIVDVLKVKLTRSFGDLRAVSNTKGSVRVALDASSIEESAYVALLTSACAALGNRAKEITELAFVNRHAAQGYVFEEPTSCPSVLNAPVAQLKVRVLAKTHLF